MIDFNAPYGYDLLAWTAVSLLFSALSQTMSGILQGIGKVYVPAIGLLVGCAIKLILNLVLIRIPAVNIYGAVISSIVCQFVAFLISFLVMVKYISLKITLMKYIVKPLCAGVLMGAAAIGVYHLAVLALGSGFKGNLIATVLAICIAACVYFVLVMVFKILNREEIETLPGGNKLYGLLCKVGLYK